MPKSDQFRSLLKIDRLEVVGVFLLFLAALLARIVPYGSYPSSMSGDEGMFANESLKVLSGEIRNPFVTGYQGHTTISFFLDAAFIELFGQTIGAIRLASGIAGALGVIALYALARHHFDRWIALGAAALSIPFAVNLFWSRNAQNNATAFLLIPLALLLLDRGLLSKQRSSAMLAGIVVGFSFFSYASNRILVPIRLLFR